MKFILSSEQRSQYNNRASVIFNYIIINVIHRALFDRPIAVACASASDRVPSSYALVLSMNCWTFLVPIRLLLLGTGVIDKYRGFTAVGQFL